MKCISNLSVNNYKMSYLLDKNLNIWSFYVLNWNTRTFYVYLLNMWSLNVHDGKCANILVNSSAKNQLYIIDQMSGIFKSSLKFVNIKFVNIINNVYIKNIL